MAEEIKDFSKLCIHSITNRPWNLEVCVKHYSEAGIKGITVWREVLEGKNIRDMRKMITNSGLEVVSLCRGGFFVAENDKKRRQAVEKNLKIIDEAAELGAPLIVLVCGAVPGVSLDDARKQIFEGISSILVHAGKCGVKLGIEPLHPMYADTRSAINTLKQANDLSVKLNSEITGVVIDVYHLWWDSELEPEINRCGKMNKMFAFHLSDWKTPTEDMLNDRGLMGEGCIPIKRIRNQVESAGFTGFNEVEIFSNHYWKTDQFQFLEKIKTSYLNFC